jgi:peptidoglycan/LPS O-acetylase OafA/YrhL
MGRRIARIYPLYWFLLAVTFLLPMLMTKAVPPSFSTVFLNVTLLKGYFSVFAYSAIGPAWSLTIEETFYLLAPVLFVFIARYGYIAAQVLLYGMAAALLFIGTHTQFGGFCDSFHFVVLYTFFGRSFEFLSGIAFARLLIVRPELFRSRHSALTMGGVLGSILVIYWLSLLKVGDRFGLFHPIGMALNNLLLPVMVCLLFAGLIAERTIIREVLSSGPFVFLGRSSYAFYLVHYGVLPLFVMLPRLAVLSEGLRIGVLFILVNVVSAALYIGVEHPMNQFVRKRVDRPMQRASEVTPSDKSSSSGKRSLFWAGALLAALLGVCAIYFDWFPSTARRGGSADDEVPSVLSVKPSSGSGGDGTFSIAVSTARPSSDLGVNLLFNSQVSSVNACHVVFNKSMNLLWLIADNGTKWMTAGLVGSGQPLSNSQCTVIPDQSSASYSGNVFTLNLKVAFKPTFSGDKNIYVMAINQAAHGNGWQQLGSWKR